MQGLWMRVGSLMLVVVGSSSQLVLFIMQQIYIVHMQRRIINDAAIILLAASVTESQSSIAMPLFWLAVGLQSEAETEALCGGLRLRSVH